MPRARRVLRIEDFAACRVDDDPRVTRIAIARASASASAGSDGGGPADWQAASRRERRTAKTSGARNPRLTAERVRGV